LAELAEMSTHLKE